MNATTRNRKQFERSESYFNSRAAQPGFAAQMRCQDVTARARSIFSRLEMQSHWAEIYRRYAEIDAQAIAPTSDFIAEYFLCAIEARIMETSLVNDREWYDLMTFAGEEPGDCGDAVDPDPRGDLYYCL